jgi:DNA-binding IclR family transcriptional regulator
MTPGDPRLIERYKLRTVERALSILRVFLDPDCRGELSLAEVSRRVGLSQSTSLRLLVSLKAAGFVEQIQSSGKYRLGATCLALGDAFLRSNNLRQRAYDSLVDLRDRCGETVHLAFLEGSEVVYLDKLAGLHPIGLMSSRAGGRAPAYCTAVGKSLLAHLPEAQRREVLEGDRLVRHTETTIVDIASLDEELDRIREQGYSIDNEERERGVGCIACPIFGHLGIVAAISVSGPVERVLNGQNRDELIRLVKETAEDISIRLGGGYYRKNDR